MFNLDHFLQDICVIKVLRLLFYKTLFVIRTIEQLMEMIVERDTDICQMKTIVEIPKLPTRVNHLSGAF